MLGKWHISVIESSYIVVCDKIDDIINKAYIALLDNVKNTGQFKKFPIPRQLTKIKSTVDNTTILSNFSDATLLTYQSKLIKA